MEFKISEVNDAIKGDLLHTEGDGNILMRIAGKEYRIRLLKSTTDEFEFLLDNKFHHAKILQNTSSEVKLLVDTQPLTVKKHSKLVEVLEKSNSLAKLGKSENNLNSQIPGRVVSISAKVGDEIKKGDVVVILESMKMQVAVKSHRDGVVKEIKVKQGATVARNDTIAAIE